MSEVQATGYCQYCGRQTMYVKPRINHILHFFLGLLTFSLWWIFVWLPLGIVNSARALRCSACGMTSSEARKVTAADAIEIARAAAPTWAPPVSDTPREPWSS